jgi:hypothetical protein
MLSACMDIQDPQRNEAYRNALSSRVRTIYDAFFRHRGMDHKALMVYWEPYGNQSFYRGVEKNKYCWHEYDLFKEKHPDAHLVVALDLQMSFEEQWPSHFKTELESFEAFVHSPLIWIADRSGRVPEKEKRAFYKSALSAFNNSLVVHENPNAKRITPEPLEKRSRSHLKLLK